MVGPGGVSCPACGEPGLGEPLVAVPDREYGLAVKALYARCEGCGTLFQHPMPDESALGATYPPDYHGVTGQGVLTRLRLALRHRQLRRVAGAARTVLDYGCGSGEFLRYVAERDPGRACFGYEIADATEVETGHGGRLTIVRGDLGTLLELLPPVSVVTMNHVIEHLPSPLDTMAALRSTLAEDGSVQGQTPAAGSLEHRTFGTRWSGFHAPRHTVVFSPEGLRRLLDRAGFGDVVVKPATNPAGIAVSLASWRQGLDGGRVRRAGPAWFCYLAAAAALTPVDRVGGAGVVDFVAHRGATA